MAHANLQKQLIVSYALARVKRASVFAESALRVRRQEILAAKSNQARYVIITMTQALMQLKVPSAGDASAINSTGINTEEMLRAAVRTFMSEPTQRVAIDCATEELSIATLADQTQHELSVRIEHSLNANISQLAWGAFSLAKVMHGNPRNSKDLEKPSLMWRDGADQLSLQDLSIIDCALRYQNHWLDYSFMGQLSISGANIIHRIAMLVSSEYRLRIDTAIVTAARMIIDPLVGGDANYCCCMLRARKLPTSLAEQYDLH